MFNLLKVVLFLIAFAPSFAWAVTYATGVTAANPSSWTQVGTTPGPMLIQCTRGIGANRNVFIAFADTPPVSLTVGFHLVSGNPFYYAGSGNIYVIGNGSCVWSQ
jgi:hypothetical protein